jgi:N-acetylneuraminic acid mutarotase
VRRRRLLALVAAILTLIVWVSLPGSSGPTAPPNSSGRRAAGASPDARLGLPQRLAVRRLPFSLPVALQAAAAAPLGSDRAVLLGGLDGADTSTASVSVLDASGVTAGPQLAEAQHDAQGALLGGRVYVFGGGQVSSYSHILFYDPATGAINQAGSLPTPTSDAAVAVIAGTAYVVGGYDGQQALNTIVAWQPGAPARVVGRLPHGLRYTAVAASGGRLVIAGGSQGEVASSAILRFDPATGQLRHIGELPAAITHASAVALGSYVYVLGGRGAAAESQTAAIVAIDAGSGHCVRVGSLPQPLSDAAAIVLGQRIWLAGGLSMGGPVATVLELTPAQGAR